MEVVVLCIADESEDNDGVDEGYMNSMLAFVSELLPVYSYRAYSRFAEVFLPKYAFWYRPSRPLA